MMQTNEAWTPSSWRCYPIAQQPQYTNKEELEAALGKLRELPPLVSREEVDDLQQKLQLVQEGKAFVIQCGDCAEAFDGCNTDLIQRKAALYEILGKIVEEVLNIPVVVIGRIAGQYAKPRSDDFEMVKGEKVPVFRGEIVNSFDISKRNPDPNRLIEAYFRSAATLNLLRQNPELGSATKTIIRDLIESGITENEATSEKFKKFEPAISRAKFENFYSSHEALLLNYEECLTRRFDDDKYYALSAPFLWIGERTRNVKDAHLDFASGIANPIGIKISDKITPEDLVSVIRKLNPNNEPGKLTLITRFGASKAEKALPPLIEAVKVNKLNVLWFADVVHGNTVKVEGIKTRFYDDLKKELLAVATLLKEQGLRLNGIHLEVTPDNVTECMGGHCKKIDKEDLPKNYTSLCDPRLNMIQSIELLMDVAPSL